MKTTNNLRKLFLSTHDLSLIGKVWLKFLVQKQQRQLQWILPSLCGKLQVQLSKPKFLTCNSTVIIVLLVVTMHATLPIHSKE